MKLVRLLLVLAACQPATPPVPPPGPDAADSAAPSTPCAAACQTLSTLGCTEGIAADCVTVMAHIESGHLVRTANGQPLTCMAVTAVHSQSDVHGLGIACTVKP
jgi:hypothetical protein